MPHTKWINFAELRRQLSLGDVLESYNVELASKPGSGQLTGPCPLPNHAASPEKKPKTFSANPAKGVWQCFGCKQSGNVIDFAVLMEGLDKDNGQHVRQVALSLRERFLAPESRSAPATREDRRNVRPGEVVREPALQEQVAVNAPLTFELKTLEANHLWFASRKLSPETVADFGLGFCRRGSLAGRIAIPIIDDSSQLVGYAGLALEDGETTDDNARYLFPADRQISGVTHRFARELFLYNGFRVGQSAKLVFIVRECADVWALSQAGIPNVVAAMGDDLSDDQAQLIPLLTADSARVWIVTDASDAGEAMARNALLKLATSRLVRWTRIPAEAGISADHPALAALPRK